MYITHVCINFHHYSRNQNQNNKLSPKGDKLVEICQILIFTEYLIIIKANNMLKFHDYTIDNKIDTMKPFEQFVTLGLLIG